MTVGRDESRISLATDARRGSSILSVSCCSRRLLTLRRGTRNAPCPKGEEFSYGCNKTSDVRCFAIVSPLSGLRGAFQRQLDVRRFRGLHHNRLARRAGADCGWKRWCCLLYTSDAADE